jgi:ribosomal protein L32
MRRAHDSLIGPTLSIESHTGEVHKRHHVSPDGYYRGRKFWITKLTWIDPASEFICNT